ncbi:outer membrane autotransporter barrel domain-containing protein [Mesorhizobium sp. L-8-3]|nr:outer membrane autotransporter barrel domain-containing protein [Mesorhizobium sp. L-8-3]
MTVTGAGSRWTNSSNLTVGEFGTATLTIESGGSVSNAFGSIGSRTGSIGTVTVNGTGSSWNNAGLLFVGSEGEGTLTIAAGGVVNNTAGFIGSVGTGTVTVTGMGSAWTNSSGLSVGFDGTATLTIADGGSVSNAIGVIGTNTGSTGTVTVTGTGSKWTNSGNMRIGSDGTGTLTIADGGTVDVVSGGGAVAIAFADGSTGTLNIGAAATDAAAAAGTLEAATLAFGTGTGILNFNHTATAYDFDAAVSGSGTINQIAGVTNLTADSSAFTGTTTITGGLLSVNGSLGGAVTVSGGTLGGSGTLAGSVSVTNGAIAAGNSPGTLTIGGDLTLASGSSLNFELGSPSGTAGVDSDLINVGGNLTLDGTLNVTDAGGFGAGLYRLVNYDGTLTDNGLEIGDAPNGFGSSNLTVQTATANQVNLLVNAPFASFWDGANTSANNAVDGGSGTWSVTGNNWTFADGSVNGVFDPSVLLIFSGTAGTVTVDDSAGAISTSAGMQFAADGYTITGDDIALTGATAFRVGDGTSAGAAFTATIASNLTGAGSLNKTDLGTLVLTGANTYTGGTTISAGTLIGNATSLQGDIVNNAALTFDQGTAGTYAGVISGTGALTKAGAGALTLSGANTYTGGTTISAGTLIGNATSLQGDFANNAALTFDQGIVGTYAGVISGTGALTKAGAGALTLSGANTYTGGTTISAGTLIGNTTSLQGDFANNAALTFDQGTAGTFAGVISGTGTLTKAGAGALTLTGANTYTGGTTISAGTLISNTTSLQGGIANNAALTFDQDTAGTFAGVISGTGALTKSGTGALTLTGNSSAYAGTTDLAAGLLAVNGSLGGAVTISGGTLGGSGTLSGNVSVTNGAIAAGNSPGTLTIGGDLLLASGSSLNFELGGPTGTAGVDSDLIVVGGGLTLDGTLNVTDAGGFGAGVYRLINYSGALTDNGLDIGTRPADFLASDLTVQTSVASEINLIVSGPSGLSFWDGANLTANGAIDGGSGTWNATDTNWTNTTGTTNGTFNAGVLQVFQGTGGTVIIDNTGGAVTTSAMQFAADGYTVAGDDLTLAGAATVRVGDGTAAGAGYTTTISSSLIGTGSLEKTDLGTLILTGANSYSGGTTISGGTLVGNTTSLQGDIVNNAALTFDQTSTGTYAGVISGSGALTKAGAGELILTGNSSAYAGTTDIAAGLLTINGSLGGTINFSSGTLGGSGTLGNVTIASGGTLAPGNSIGTLNVVNITLDAGSTYTVELDDGGFVAGTNNDLVNATGKATINGGTVHVTPENGTDDGTTYTPGTYTILTAAGGVTGTFDAISDDYAFLNFALGYDANNVFLTSSLATAGFCLTGMTANQCAAGNGVFSLDSGSLYTAVLNLSNAEVSGALDQLSGEVHASAKTAMIEDSRFLRNAVNDRIRAAFDGVGASGGTVTTYGDGGLQAAATTDRFALWGQGFGSWGHTNGDGNAARLSRSTGGFFIGADAPVFDTWRFGAVAGYSSTSFDVKDRFSSGSSDNYHVGLYGGTTWGDLALRTGVAYTWHDISTSRNVSFTGVSDSLKGDYNASTTQAFGELGYRVALGSVAFEPFANLAYVGLDTDGFTEKGGVAALSGANGSTDTTFTTLGLRASTTFDLNGASLTAKGMLGWRHAFGDVASETAMQFGGGNTFTIAGVPIARDAAVVEVGLDYAISPFAGVGVSYSGQFGDDLADQSFRANFNVKF